MYSLFSLLILEKCVIPIWTKGAIKGETNNQGGESLRMLDEARGAYPFNVCLLTVYFKGKSDCF